MPQLTITYSGKALPVGTTSSAGLTLEQMPLPAPIGTANLQAMLSSVTSGLAAASYSPPDCPATILDGQVIIPLTVWVWPSGLSLEYQLSAALGEIGPPVRIEQEREFDLVINFASETVLPFFCADLSWGWSEMGAYDRMGRLVDPPPAVTSDGTKVTTSGDWLGVIRVRCRAIGYAHAVTMTLPKSAATKVTDIKNSVTAAWDQDGHGQAISLDLKIPSCVEDLLAMCPDGAYVRDRVLGSVTKEELVPVVYYNDCNGQVLVVRYERP